MHSQIYIMGGVFQKFMEMHNMKKLCKDFTSLLHQNKLML